MIKTKIISSLENVLLHDSFHKLKSINRVKAAKGERVSFQIAVKNERQDARRKINVNIKPSGELAKFAKIFRVGHVPVHMPAYEGADDNYISKTPGLFPDVLFPIDETTIVPIEISNVTTVWVTVDLPKTIKAGVHTISVEISSEKFEQPYTETLEIEVKKTVIAQNDLIFTQWFHCDSIASYFDVPMMSKKHWVLIERFIKTAARTGITMLLTPLFTPPLDTEVGGERPTMQLVTVSKSGDKYSFDFTLVDKWVKICKKYGIKYYEMSHLFTQWGVAYCPKIIVDGEREFGWHTDAMGEPYKNFLSQFLPELTKHLKELGIAEYCYFHISDEPSSKPDRPDFENYKAAKEFVKPYLEGFKLIDALSSVDFYDNGLVEIPIPSNNHIEPFLEREIDERWTYYCCGQGYKVSNRFIAMPSARNRVLGAQMYMFDIVGFLQWGYNFYYSDRTRYKIDPYQTNCGDNAWPAGDPFSVYPYKEDAIESLRTVVFFEGLQDRMLLKQLEQKIGKDKVKQLILDLADGEFTFSDYPTEDAFVTKLHDTVLDMLG